MDILVLSSNRDKWVRRSARVSGALPGLVPAPVVIDRTLGVIDRTPVPENLVIDRTFPARLGDTNPYAREPASYNRAPSP